MKTLATILSVVVAAAMLAIGVAPAQAAPVSGAYDTRTADGSKTTPANDVNGPWVLTSTDSTASWLRRYFDGAPTFGSLTDLNVTFTSPTLNAQANSDGALTQATNNAGGGLGAPRLTLALDSDNDTTADKFIDIHLGTSSTSFIDTPTALTALSGMNLIGNNDTGRYDLSSAGGSVYTDYNAALALAGSWTVLRGTLFLDSYGGADKTLNVSGINASAVPEPTGLALLGLGAGALLLRRRGRRA